MVVKKYANRRLYNTESSSYITLDNLAEMIRQGRDFVVYDAKSGEDITRSVLTQIIVEEEGKGRAMLPTGFLRQLIGFYGDNLQNLVPRYLEQAMAAFAAPAAADARRMQQTMGSFFPFGNMEEVEPAEYRDDGTGHESVHAILSPAGAQPEAGAGRAEHRHGRAGNRRAAGGGGGAAPPARRSAGGQAPKPAAPGLSAGARSRPVRQPSPEAGRAGRGKSLTYPACG